VCDIRIAPPHYPCVLSKNMLSNEPVKYSYFDINEQEGNVRTAYNCDMFRSLYPQLFLRHTAQLHESALFPCF
jgi:hypothetical protein